MAFPPPKPAAGYDLIFELPRAGLEFELACGELRSRDFAGYRLRPCQQLTGADEGGAGQGHYTLPEFSRYLVLKRAPAGEGGGSSSSSGAVPGQQQQQWADELVLVPAGDIVRGGGGEVDVAVYGGGGSGVALTVSRLRGE